MNGRLAAEAGNTAAAAHEMEAYAAANADPAISDGDTSYNCYLAPVEEAASHPDLADAAIKAGGHFVDCARFKADILDHRGDWPAAQRAYAAAVAMAPDLPAAYYSWGQALARHNNPDGAIEKLSAAAAAKYDAALQYAPAWPELKSARAAIN